MINKKIRDAITQIYKLNDEVDENTFIYAFPSDMLLVEPLITTYAESIEKVYALPEDEENDDSMCTYMIAVAKTENDGTIIFAFTSGLQVGVMIRAIKNILAGKDPE